MRIRNKDSEMWQGEIWEPEFCSCNNHNDAKCLDIQTEQVVYTTHGTVSKIDQYCYVQNTAQLVYTNLGQSPTLISCTISVFCQGIYGTFLANLTSKEGTDKLSQNASNKLTCYTA
jgi:hypothetical protein